MCITGTTAPRKTRKPGTASLGICGVADLSGKSSGLAETPETTREIPKDSLFRSGHRAEANKTGFPDAGTCKTPVGILAASRLSVEMQRALECDAGRYRPADAGGSCRHRARCRCCRIVILWPCPCRCLCRCHILFRAQWKTSVRPAYLEGIFSSVADTEKSALSEVSEKKTSWIRLYPSGHLGSILQAVGLMLAGLRTRLWRTPHGSLAAGHCLCEGEGPTKEE